MTRTNLHGRKTIHVSHFFIIAFILSCLFSLPNLLLAQDNSSTLRVFAISEAEGTTIIGATVLLTVPNAYTRSTPELQIRKD